MVASFAIRWLVCIGLVFAGSSTIFGNFTTGSLIALMFLVVSGVFLVIPGIGFLSSQVLGVCVTAVSVFLMMYWSR